jgi:hypothetical protein
LVGKNTCIKECKEKLEDRKQREEEGTMKETGARRSKEKETKKLKKERQKGRRSERRKNEKVQHVLATG